MAIFVRIPIGILFFVERQHEAIKRVKCQRQADENNFEQRAETHAIEPNHARIERGAAADCTAHRPEMLDEKHAERYDSTERVEPANPMRALRVHRLTSTDVRRRTSTDAFFRRLI